MTNANSAITMVIANTTADCEAEASNSAFCSKVGSRVYTESPVPGSGLKHTYVVKSISQHGSATQASQSSGYAVLQCSALTDAQTSVVVVVGAAVVVVVVVGAAVVVVVVVGAAVVVVVVGCAVGSAVVVVVVGAAVVVVVSGAAVVVVVVSGATVVVVVVSGAAVVVVVVVVGAAVVVVVVVSGAAVVVVVVVVVGSSVVVVVSSSTQSGACTSHWHALFTLLLVFPLQSNPSVQYKYLS